MPNDAKLGLIFGIGLVVLIGVVFFRRDPTPAAPAAAVQPVATQSMGPVSLPTIPPDE